MFRKPVLASLGAVLAASLAVPAVAQDEDVPQFIEEIVVLATKREQTLQEVPVAVSVVTAETIDEAQVRDIKDFQTLVPSLRVTQLQTSGNTNFIIRGFGNGANNAGIEPSVGVFVDGVYRSRTASALADLPKLERVEVLRGPQSTLFGKNASAGVINIVTAKPDLNAYSGSASLVVADDNQIVVKGDVTGPLSDSAGWSLSGSVNQRDGYYENLEGGDALNEWNRWNVRGQLMFVPNDQLELRFIADAESIDEACCGVANLLDGPTGLGVRAVGGNLVPNAPFAYEGYYNYTPTNEVETSGISMHIDYDFSEVTFQSITAFRTLKRDEDADSDFTSADLLGIRSSDTDVDTFTQEFRLVSSGDGDLDWLVGLFYFDEEVAIQDELRYGDDFRNYGDFLSTVLTGGIPGVDPSPLGQLEAALMLPAGTFYAAGTGQPEMNGGQDDQTLSVFGQIDWHMSDRATLTLGANYTEVEKDAFVNIVGNDVFSAVDMVQVGFAQIFGQLTGGLPPTPANIAANPVEAATAQALSQVSCSPATGPACNPLLALQPFQFLPPFVNYPNVVEPGTTNDDATTWTVRFAYDVTDSVNMYASAGTGFKASSWNLSLDSRPFAEDIPALEAANLTGNNLIAGTRFAGPEDSTVYEIGLKAQLDTFAINAAIFTQEIEGFQSNIFGGTGFNLANAGKQSTDGLEIDMTWYPVEGLRLFFAGTWLDPIYDSFEQGNGVDGQEDLSGTKPAGIPEFAANVNAMYSFDVGASASGFFRIEYVYEDEVQVVENVPASVASREISMLNASLGFSWDNGLDATLWGRNINEDEYLQSAFPSVAQNGSYSGYPNIPSSYGLTLRYNFD